MRRFHAPAFTLALLACPEPAEDGEAGDSTDTTTDADEPDLPSETDTTDDGGCPVGIEGCPCSDAQSCFPGLECEADVCVPADPSGDGDGDGDCTEVILGSVDIQNSAVLDQMVGVYRVVGSVTVFSNIGPVPQLGCLREVTGTLMLNSGVDYSAMESVEAVADLRIAGGPGTTLPSLENLTLVDDLWLWDVMDELALPQVDSLNLVFLDSSSAPVFGGLTQLPALEIAGAQGNYDGLDGLEVERFEVSDFTGDSLPSISVKTEARIISAPSVVSLPLSFPPSFPEIAPQEDTGSDGLYLQGTGLPNLDSLAPIETFTTRPVIIDSPNLTDISGLENIVVDLAWEIPPEFVSLNITNAPMLCRSHAEAIAATATVPTFVALYQLKDDC